MKDRDEEGGADTHKRRADGMIVGKRTRGKGGTKRDTCGVIHPPTSRTLALLQKRAVLIVLALSLGVLIIRPSLDLLARGGQALPRDARLFNDFHGER